MESPAQELSFKNPAGFEIPIGLLQDFERGLDPLNPGNSDIPCRVLGYGEISTVFEILVDGMQSLAFKRMPIFQSVNEMRSYVETYVEYNYLLHDVIGLHLPVHGYAALISYSGRPIFYIIQEKQASGSICSSALIILSDLEILALFQAILYELHKVWDYNRNHPEDQVGVDGQVSNWAIAGFDRKRPAIWEDMRLYYIDTSTPLFCKAGVEQLNPELFLRSAPPYLVWILRLLFVKDVMTRYYDPRKVTIDLIANFYKEQKPKLIPDLIVFANDFFLQQAAEIGVRPITPKEVADYYREDRIIWSMYLSMRRFDRFTRKELLHRDYPYILPGKIKR